ncbi:MAG: GDSL-type esterase/lipase family protein [Oscillospiraceae bacterium]|nr:GDSL-type esterase/lipase family protein [Oscillospiraceae bacterium]
MPEQSTSLTNKNPRIAQYKDDLRARYAQENQTAQKGQIVFVGSSLMEIFPIEEMQKTLGLDKAIYNRGIRATTTAELLAAMDVCIFDLAPRKIFINIGSNDVGYNVPESTFLANYDEILRQCKEKLPQTQVYVMAYYPVNPAMDSVPRTNAMLAAASEKVAQLAQKHRYAFINVNTGLTDADGNLRKELTFDGAHMYPAGYEIVLANMKQYF